MRAADLRLTRAAFWASIHLGAAAGLIGAGWLDRVSGRWSLRAAHRLGKLSEGFPAKGPENRTFGGV